MVRANTKSSDKQTVSTPAPVQVPAVQPAGAKADVKKAKKAPAVKGETTQSTGSVENVHIEPLATKSSASVVAESTDDSISNKINTFGGKLQQLAGFFNSVKTDFKLLEKLVSRELKNAQKITSRRKKSSGNRQPSGFIKPTRISDELAQFLGKTIGTEMARTEVSKEINAYIISHNLQDKANGRKINADAKLSSLLKLNKEDELTYFNLQRYMKYHFIKAEPVVAPAVTV